MSYSVKEQLRRVRRMQRDLHPVKTVTICIDEDGRVVSASAEVKPGDKVIYRNYGVRLDRV